ncbi:class F sortase [Streptomyces sp. NPDC019531]|uniref:class F sortase n=1 Tax=Streptomyces sp. NPDC019531 TaxID=3365062 RepID=UPI00384F5F22
MRGRAPSRAAVARVLAVAVLAGVLVGCGGPGGSPAVTGTSGGSSTATGTSSGGSVSAPSGAKSVGTLGRSIPVALRIPAVGVDTPLIRLGLAKDGSVQVPPIAAHDRAGWYEHSPTPGQQGPSVILGHVTVGSYGDGVFRHLTDLRKGDEIETRLKNGMSAVFAVTEVRTVAKADFPTKEVYGDVDRPELRLITCGGARTGDGYLDNVIVFAALRSVGP